MAITDTSPDIKNIVLNLVKNYGTERAIKIATGYGIPLEAISFALSTPIGQGAVQDFNQMKSDLGGPIVGTAKNLGNVIKSAFSSDKIQPSVANQGIVSTQQGNYKAPIMTQQEMVREAQRTGGTVNPHEVTKAVYTPSTKPKAPPGRPIYGPHGKAEGGIVNVLSYLNGGEVENTPSVEDKQNEIIKHLKDKGYSNAAISGILGNIDVETGSTFDFQQEEEGEGKGYGLFQFDFMKSHYDGWLNKNKKDDSIQSQIDFMDDIIQGKKFIDTKDGKIEMLSPKERVKLQTLLRESDDPSETALEFNKIFEKGKFNDRRVDSALSFSNTLSSPVSPDSQEGGLTSVLESLSPRMAGGGIMDYTRGGHAMGPGTGTSDSIPAFLSDGEFVMTNKAVKGFGGGNREQGAQKLYNMMKKAEAGA